MTLRGLLYRMARLAGDVNAAKRGRLGRRIIRRRVTRSVFRWFR